MEKNSDEVYDFYYEFIKYDHSDVDFNAVKKLANYFYRKDNFQKAYELFQIAAEKTADNENLSTLHNDMGCCYLEFGEVIKAAEAFRKATTLNKQNACAYNNLAYTLAVECDTIKKDKIWEEKLADALKYIKIAIDIESASAYYNNKALIEYALEMNSDAEKTCCQGLNQFENYNERKTLIEARILARLEQYEVEPNQKPNIFKEILADLDEIFDKDTGDDKYFFEGLKAYKKLTGLTEEEKEKLTFLLFLLEFNIGKVKDELVVRDLKKGNVTYYTSLDSLYFILNDEKDEIKYKMPIFDVNHMNDPNEGITLQKCISLLNGCLQEILGDDSSDELLSVEAEDLTFIKSFSRAVDSLPMWVQYGENGNGCCVKVNPRFFTNLSYQSTESKKQFESSAFKDDYKLYNVIYIRDKDELKNQHPKIYALLCRIASITNDIKSIYSKCNSIGQSLVSDLVNKIISSIKYLFKDSTYAQELEMRIIINRSYNDLTNEECDIKTTKTSPIPKIFIPSIKPIQIDEIILGPKLLNTNDYIPYISMQLCKINGGNGMGKIKKSAIRYR